MPNDTIDAVAELAIARATIKRLNRRCQIAEAAANLQAEKWDQRSRGQGRAYIWELGLWHVIARVLSHWHTQGGLSQFGGLGQPTNEDELVAAILRVVRANREPQDPR